MSHNEKGCVYDKAPVAEVIAEVLWQLKPLLGSDLAYDSFFDDLTENFRLHFKDQFPHMERIIPAEVPREILSYKPIFRYRAEKDSWPLYQIGPGIMTANIVPPYEGWPKFFPVVSEGLKALYQSYPSAERHLRPNTLRLIYINAFGPEHGYSNQREFLQDGLKFTISPPAALNEHIEEASTVINSTFDFRLKNQADTFATVRIASGISRENPALIVENVIYKNVGATKLSRQDIEDWFDQAHDSNYHIFQSYITEKTLLSFGNPR